MNRIAIRIASTVVLALISAGDGAMVANAYTVVVGGGDTVTGVFSNVVTQGNLLNVGGVGNVTFADNSGTYVVGPATYGGSACAGGNTLCWGVGPDLNIPLTETYSELTFTGSGNFNPTSGAPQFIGTLGYANGTSDTSSLIFGATLTLFDNSDLLGSYSVIITTTSNQYSGQNSYTVDQLNTDADYVNICGHESNICGDSIEAYEAGEGGQGLLVDLTGQLEFDPQLFVNGVRLDPLDANCPNCGIVGNEPAGAVTPEPPSVVLLSTAVMLFACFGFRSRLKGLAGSRV